MPENKYTVEDEKLCLNGKPTALIFGDQDQIKAIRKHEERTRKLNFEGLEIYPDYEIKFRFKCICDRTLHHDEEVTGNEITEFEPNHTVTCSHCQREYEFESEGNGDYVVKCIGFNKP